MSLHEIIAAAADGAMPRWACFSDTRYAHMERVASLLDAWAVEMGLAADERARWRAAGFLHDAVKGIEGDELRRWLGDAADGIADPVLHGPAAALRLRQEGITDESLLGAVAWHTLGDVSLDRLGRMLYIADFLEPGRDLRNEWRAELRARVPDDWPGVLREIVAARINYLVGRERRVHTRTLSFWNSMVEGEAWARASEV